MIRTAEQIGELSIKLADAAIMARAKGDDVHALLFALKAAETLQLAKALGWKPREAALAAAAQAREEAVSIDHVSSTRPETSPGPAPDTQGRADIVELLRRACHYDNIGPRVRSFQSSASNGLVLDAADRIASLERQLAEAREAAAAEIERLRALSQNNANSWDAIVRERDALRAEIKRLRDGGPP